jgi:hypothetical protein
MTYAIQQVPYSLRKAFGTSPPELTGSGVPQYGSQNSLVGWWRLNTDVSSAGNVADASGNSRNGTFDAAANRPAYSSVLYPSTRIQAASNVWDGSNDAANIGTGATWNAIIGSDTAGGSTQQFTLAAWIYRTGDGGSGAADDASRIVEFGSNLQCALFTGPVERLRFSTRWNGGAKTSWYTDTYVVAVDAWTHVAVTYDATGLGYFAYTYINGAAVSNSRGGFLPTGAWDGIDSEDCFIGNSPAGDRAFEGNLADVAVWNKVLTATEIKAIYDVSNGPAYRVGRNFNLRGSNTAGGLVPQSPEPMIGGKALGPTGSIDPFRQGINVSTSRLMMMGLLPKMGPGKHFQILVDGHNVSTGSIFSDMIIADASGSSLGSQPRTMVPNFLREERTLGQPKLFKDDAPYEEMQRYNAEAYLTDDSGAMIYPYIGSNISMNDPYQMDGVLEPLTIRDAASRNQIDFPFDAYSIWASLESGYALDSRRGGVLITQQVANVNVTSSLDPFEDSVQYFLQPTLSYSIASGSVTASVEFPGYLTDQQASVVPFADVSVYAQFILPLSGSSAVGTLTQQESDDNAIRGAVAGMTGSTNSMFRNDHHSAPAGFVYINSPMGTDSLAFGGLKK